jgi:hypothetical protein
MKKYIPAITFILFLGAGSFWLYAKPSSLALALQSALPQIQTIDHVQASPNTITSNQPTMVTVSAQVGVSAALLPNSINLIRYNEQGQVIENMGQMYDDGSHGDVLRGDNVFTKEVTLNEAQPQTIYFKASVANRERLLRTLSEAAPLFVQSVITPEQTLALIANQIEAGNIEEALKRFSPSPLNRDILSNLDSNQRTRLAAALRNARLLNASDNIRVYAVSWTEDDGSPTELKISMSHTVLNDWYIMAW